MTETTTENSIRTNQDMYSNVGSYLINFVDYFTFTGTTMTLEWIINEKNILSSDYDLLLVNHINLAKIH